VTKMRTSILFSPYVIFCIFYFPPFPPSAINPPLCPASGVVVVVFPIVYIFVVAVDLGAPEVGHVYVLFK